MPETLVQRREMLLMLAGAFKVPPEGGDALTARVRLLNDLGIPRTGRAGAHVRLRYGLLEVAEIATALCLMDSHVPPAAAAWKVLEAWGGFVRLAFAAIIDEVPAELRPRYRSMDRGRFGVIRSRVLSTLGGRQGPDAGGELVSGTLHLTSDLHEPVGGGVARSGIVVDAGDYMPSLLKSFGAARMPHEDLRAMLDRLRDSGRVHRAAQNPSPMIRQAPSNVLGKT
jgi:hypothetical protein